MKPVVDHLHVLNDLLDQTVKNADQCSKMLLDIEELDTVTNTRKIGAALTQLLDLQNEIYRMRPDLLPTHLKAATESGDDNRKIGSIILEAAQLCQSNQSIKAQGLLRNHINQSSSEYEMQVLKTELARIQRMNIN